MIEPTLGLFLIFAGALFMAMVITIEYLIARTMARVIGLMVGLGWAMVHGS